MPSRSLIILDQKNCLSFRGGEFESANKFKNMKTILIALILTLGFALPALSQSYTSPSDFPNPKDYGDGFICDPQDYINVSDEAKINTLITEIRDEKGFEVVVIIVESIGGKSPSPLATDIGNHWGVGKGDRGIVILVGVLDREMAIASGYEAEKFFTDLVTQHIQTEEIVPYMKTADYSYGLYNGVLTIRNIAMDEDVPYYYEEAKQQHAYNQLWEKLAIGAAILLLILGVVVTQKLEIAGQYLLILAVCAVVATIAYYGVLKDNYTITVILDVFYILSFIAIAVNTFRVIKKETKKIWPFAAYMILVVPIPLVGLYFYGFAEILIVYCVGAGFVFGLFLLLYLISLTMKSPYKKYHTIQLFKLDVFSYIFPLPMYVVDMMVENLMESWRNKPRFSKTTGLEMRKLSESEEDKYLKGGQVSEEKVKSVDYDVWISDKPEDLLILKYKSWFSGYSSCSKCKYKTWYLVYDKTISSATYSSSGTGEKKKACAHCKHQSITRYTIPRKQRSSSSSSGGGFSSGGSSGGGSFGGGSLGGGGSSSSW